MEMSAQSKDDEYENTRGIYTGLILPDNNEYSTLNSNPIPEAQQTAKRRQCCPPYKVATVCLGLLCAFLVIVIIILFVYWLDEKHLGIQPRMPTPSNATAPCAVPTLSPVEVPKQCPVYFVPFNSRCYHISPRKDTWLKSRNFCKSMGADLVVIDSMEEQVFVNGNCEYCNYWIGLRKLSEGRTWLWVDGSQLDVGYWRDREPNNQGGNESCVHGSGKHDALKNWNDIKCNTFFYRVCEANRP